MNEYSENDLLEEVLQREPGLREAAWLDAACWQPAAIAAAAARAAAGAPPRLAHMAAILGATTEMAREALDVCMESRKAMLEERYESGLPPATKARLARIIRHHIDAAEAAARAAACRAREQLAWLLLPLAGGVKQDERRKQ